MKYTTILNGREREIEIIQKTPHEFEILIDGRSHVVEARSCGGDLISLLMDNRSYDISYSLDGDVVHLGFRNQYFGIEVLDERKMRMRRVRSSLHLSGPEIIKSSMPGRVVKVLVAEGEQVKSGTGVIIIEAMKMENEIQCHNTGRIKAVHVGPGQAIESDATLVEIEPES